MTADRHRVLLHGTPLTPQVWHAVAGRLARHGAVSVPAVTPRGADRSTGALARRVLAETPGELDVVGHSYGGQIAIDMALLAPDRVRSLVVVCSRDTPYPAFAAAARAVREGAPVDVDAALARWFRPAELDSGGPLIDYARDCLVTADRSAWADALADIAGYDRGAQVARLPMPVLAIAAEHDTVSPPSAMADLCGRLRTAELRIIPGAGHLSTFTHPAQLADLIVRRPG